MKIEKKKIAYLNCPQESSFLEWRKNLKVTYIFIKLLTFNQNANRECPIPPPPFTRDGDAKILLGSEMSCPFW